MNKLLTVIVPAYNMQDYLERCLDSLQCMQQLRLQVIVVNDGSKDQIYQQFFVLFHKKIIL